MQEWIHTNGLGAYASSSISGMNTRRYHGLLIAALNPPADRRMIVTKTEEEIELSNGNIFQLGTNEFPHNILYPQGYQYLTDYKAFPLPEFIFSNEAFSVKKTIFYHRQHNTVFIEYQNLGNEPVTLHIAPFWVYRDYHSLFHENSYYDFYTESLSDKSLKVYPHYGSIPIYQKFTAGNWEEKIHWINHVQYEEEKLRGLEHSEDYYVIGRWHVTLNPKEKAFIGFSTDENMLSLKPETIKKETLSYLKSIRLPQYHSFYNDLLQAADQFLIHRNSTDSKSIIAGYHWFLDWGRDTMIAMRGMTIATGKKAECQSILKTFLESVSLGMIPNRFPDNPDEPIEYNTVDATLWMFIILYEYMETFKDKAFIKKHFSVLTDIIDHHFKGTRYAIHALDNGLLYAGEGDSQLTWMDARIGDYAVTPRHGCPVEINALWYNALKIYQYFAEQLKIEIDEEMMQVIKTFPAVFQKYFYNEQGYLNDVIIPDEKIDDSIRPNQIYALSLPFELLRPAQAKSVLKNVEEYLYTPLGLRTLNIENPQFKPVYEGDIWQRDTAYHQGTVWPFLLQGYWTAKYKLARSKPIVKNLFFKELQTIQKHFYSENGIFGISEIFDGLQPEINKGKGTIQQAWSISAFIKLMKDFELEKIK